MANGTRSGFGHPTLISIPLVLALICVIATVALGYWSVSTNLHWFAGLRRPSLRLPILGFGLLWGLLQSSMLLALARVLRSPDWMPDRSAAVQAFFLQAAIQAVWPVVVFGLHRPRLGLLIGLGLAVQLMSTARLFRRVERLAGILVLPNLACTVFVGLLNLSIVIRN